MSGGLNRAPLSLFARPRRRGRALSPHFFLTRDQRPSFRLRRPPERFATIRLIPTWRKRTPLYRDLLGRTVPGCPPAGKAWVKKSRGSRGRRFVPKPRCRVPDSFGPRRVQGFGSIVPIGGTRHHCLTLGRAPMLRRNGVRDAAKASHPPLRRQDRRQTGRRRSLQAPGTRLEGGLYRRWPGRAFDARERGPCRASEASFPPRSAHGAAAPTPFSPTRNPCRRGGGNGRRRSNRKQDTRTRGAGSRAQNCAQRQNHEGEG